MRRRVERLITRARSFAFAAPVTLLAVAASMALALTGPAAAQIGQFRIYIYNAAGGVADTYVLTDGARATAATVRNCVGRRTPNASGLVAQLDERIGNGLANELNPVTIIGPGSEIELGSCEPSPTRDAADHDSLVVVVDASERQARRLIRQIHALPRGEQMQMLAELGLSHR